MNVKKNEAATGMVTPQLQTFQSNHILNSGINEVLCEMEKFDFFPESIDPDGKIHRFKRAQGDRKPDAWYICHEFQTKQEARYICTWGDWRDSSKYEFKSYKESDLTAEERENLQKKRVEARDEQQRMQLLEWENTSLEVQKKWSSLSSDGTTEYLNRKQISQLFGARIEEDERFGPSVQVPIRDVEGKLWSIQKIQSDTKFFYPGGKKQGCFHLIGALTEVADIVCVSEGFATGASVHMATGKPVVVAFDAGSLESVVSELAKKYPKIKMVICGDEDRFKGSINTGRVKAEQAAKLVKGIAVFPRFKSLEKEPTDFNDLHLLEGLPEVGKQIEEAILTIGESAVTDSYRADWGPLKPLPPLRPEAPALPSEMIPEPFRDWLMDVSDRLCVAPEAVTVPALISVAACLGRKVGIFPVPFDSWYEIPVFWGGVVGNPGTKKSACIEEGAAAISRIQNELDEKWSTSKHEEVAKRYSKEAERKIVEEEIDEAIKNQEGDLARYHTRLAEISQDLEKLRKSGARLIENDATVQALQISLSVNPQGMVLLCDELTGLLSTLERDDQRDARAFMLTSYNGKNSFHVNRVGRGELDIPAAAIWIAGGIQPDRLEELFLEQLRDGKAGDGLFSRMLCSVFPELPVFERKNKKPNVQAFELAYSIHKQLYEMDFQKFAWEPIKADIFGVRFQLEAQKVFDEFQWKLHKRMRESLDSPAIIAWLSKTEGLFPRLALVFEMIAMAAGVPFGGGVSLHSADLALNWVNFLEAHMRKIYGAALHPAIVAAHEIVRKIQTSDITDGITIREIYRAGWSGLSDRDIVHGGVRLLVDLGWLKIDMRTTGNGGRPSEIILINPAFFSSAAK